MTALQREIDNWEAFKAEQALRHQQKTARGIRETQARRRKATGYGGCGHEDYPCCGCDF